jgi:hypothetical protein
MLFEASIRSKAPLEEPPGDCTPSPTTGPSFSVTVSCPVESGRV